VVLELREQIAQEKKDRVRDVDRVTTELGTERTVRMQDVKKLREDLADTIRAASEVDALTDFAKARVAKLDSDVAAERRERIEHQDDLFCRVEKEVQDRTEKCKATNKELKDFQVAVNTKDLRNEERFTTLAQNVQLAGRALSLFHRARVQSAEKEDDQNTLTPARTTAGSFHNRSRLTSTA